MKQKTLYRGLAVLLLLALLTLSIATPAQAFTGRSGNNIVIEEGEVIDDDLYVGADSVLVKGVIKGDLIAGAGAVTIAPTGVVEGDLIAAGQSVVVQGKVGGDTRIAGMVLVIEKGASLGKDLLAFGYSVEVEKDTTVGQDAVLGAGVASISGDVARNLNAGVEGLEVNGKVGGDIYAEVGGGDVDYTPVSFFRQPGMPQPVVVPAGLTLGRDAAVSGNLTYTAPKEFSLPESAVTGKTTFRPRPVDQTEKPPAAPVQPSAAAKLGSWLLALLRSLAALLILGFILAYFFPQALREGAQTLQAQPLQSFLWGLVVYVGFFFLLAVLIFTVIMAAVVLGIITLGELVWTVLGIGALAFTAFTVSFHVAVSYVSKILVGYLIGRWLFEQVKPDLSENRFWPAVVGVVLFALAASLPYVGWIINLFAVLFGLGALFLMVRSRYQRQGDQAPLAAAAA